MAEQAHGAFIQEDVDVCAGDTMYVVPVRLYQPIRVEPGDWECRIEIRYPEREPYTRNAWGPTALEAMTAAVDMVSRKLRELGGHPRQHEAYTMPLRWEMFMAKRRLVRAVRLFLRIYFRLCH